MLLQAGGNADTEADMNKKIKKIMIKKERKEKKNVFSCCSNTNEMFPCNEMKKNPTRHL